jgi:ketopantoate hydroxymethyltransferase
MHDLLGVFPGRKAKFVKALHGGQTNIDAAVVLTWAPSGWQFPGQERTERRQAVAASTCRRKACGGPWVSRRTRA